MSKKIKLLIVDDEVKFLDSIAKRLELRDFDVTKATNGQEAIKATHDDKFDLALLDLKMAVECTKLGAFSYLPKPYELEKLIKILQQAFEARLKKKFNSDQVRMEKLAKLATGSSALGILRAMREMDDDEK